MRGSIGCAAGRAGSLVVVAILAASAGCTWGVGRPTAARQPLLARDGKGGTIYEWRQHGWAAIGDAPGTRFKGSPPIGYGFHAGIRKGWSGSGQVEGQPKADLDITEMHADLSAGFIWVQVGVSYLRTWHNSSVDYTGSGPELRASLSPIGPISLDLGYGFLDGEAGFAGTTVPDTTAHRSTIGATLIPLGVGVTRIGVKVDYHRLSDLYVPIGGTNHEFKSSGVTAELLVTWY